MIDFHAHLLPALDDGARSVEESLAMLRMSREQGVKLICCTPHFYAWENDPVSFLRQRQLAFEELQAAMEDSGESFPQLRPGAEVYYFPGMGVCSELSGLMLTGTPFLLVEPPMAPVSETVLDEICQTGDRLRCRPVIAHVDRYMRMTGDFALPRRLAERRLLMQFNAGPFLRPDSSELMLSLLEGGLIHFLGSDCHNGFTRPPNLGPARDACTQAGLASEFQSVFDRLQYVLPG